MKSIKESLINCILMVLALSFIACESTDRGTDQNQPQNTIVLLKFKTQPEKEAETVLELTKLIENVKLEPHFIKIKLHVDSKDPTNVLLYEEWADENYYSTAHMETEHITAFMQNSRNFLVGPPEITFWKLKKEFK